MMFTSKARRRGYKVFDSAEDVENEPLLPGCPKGWGEAVEMSDNPRRGGTGNDDTRRDDTKWSDVKGGYTKGATPTTGRKFKTGKRSAPREGRKKKYEKISRFFARIARASAAHSLLSAHQTARTTLQLANPPFMLSAGVFMFYY